MWQPKTSAVPFVRIRGYLFGSFSHEPTHEAAHVHVKAKGGRAKLWLDPVRLVFSTYTRSETHDIVEIVTDRQEQFLERWREHFGNR